MAFVVYLNHPPPARYEFAGDQRACDRVSPGLLWPDGTVQCGFACTRKRGHTEGPREAQIPGGLAIATWEDTDVLVLEIMPRRQSSLQ